MADLEKSVLAVASLRIMPPGCGASPRRQLHYQIIASGSVGDVDVAGAVHRHTVWGAEAGEGQQAIAFCVGTPRFDVLQLPGSLTDEERWALAEGLEDTGLFTIDASE
jgi:hypothetical protein